MIDEISIKNFRSIRNQTIRLSPLTVIIGANNSGKSNLIKAIQFIGNIARAGLRNSVRTSGTFEDIIPKYFPLEKAKAQRCELEIMMTLKPYTRSSLKPRTMRCSYKIKFGKSEPRRSVFHRELRIINESITISNPLWFTSAVIDREPPYYPSSMISISIENMKKYVDISPPFTDKNHDLYQRWLLPVKFSKATFQEEEPQEDLQEMQKDWDSVVFSLIQTRGTEIDFGVTNNIVKGEYDSIFSTIFSDLCYQFTGVTSLLRNIRRYDLSREKLRSEQRFSTKIILEKDGDNLPSILRFLQENKRVSYNRIIKTVEEISPSIEGIKTNTLRTGKEYVAFKENMSKREIESWESSDGSLRMVGVLAALESQPDHSCILLEEPEVGLHPWAMEPLINHIREVMKEKNLQVILTTHSENILEQVNKNEVLICDREYESGTIFSRIDDIVPNADTELDEIGELWKHGQLRGVP